MEKNKLNDQINIMRKNKLDLTCTSYSIIDEYDNIKSVRKVGNEITYDQISKRCDIGLSTVIIKSKILKKYKFPLLKTQEDLGLWLNLLRDGQFLSH